ncbi:MAG TPA: TerB family tellurite resistance protein [Marinagarivorans sp.]
MLSKILDIFQAELQPETNTALSDDQKRLACAALLIEVAIVDNEFDAQELACLQQVLEESFDIPADQSAEFISLAQNECIESTSMYEFTQRVNTHCTPEDKFDLIAGMWRIAYADGELDKYEEYVIRKVADLIHVAHSEFIRAKHQSRPN